MPVIATGANKETSSLIFTPVSLSGSQAANGKAGSAPSMIPEKKQNSQFSDIDLAKVTMQDTQQHQQQVHPSPSSSSASSSSGDGTTKEWLGPSECAKSRNSGGNTTERVPVASSEHVAEIVGRQGSKIKALRAKTNTYIKTPVRGEEPVFVVTGRADDVIAAKMEILSVAEHFDHVMALNKARPLPAPPSESDGDGNGSQDSSANHVTVRVRVPYRVVGLLVGPKGATIKRIQLDSQTYIVTPSRDKEPIFEITGTPENVERAKAEIEGYIALRTGIADLAPLQHQPTLSPQLQQQQQQQQQQLSKFFLPPLNDFSALLASPPSGSSFNALQLLNSLNGSPGDIYATGSHVGNIGQQNNPQLMNHATAALLGGHSQPMMKSTGKGAIWSEVKNDPKAWPSAIADVLGTGLPPWFAGTGGAGQGRHLIENGMRKMSLGSCRETPVCSGKSYHDDIFDSPVLNPSNVLGASETSPMLNHAPNLADLCNYDSRFNNAFALVTNNNNSNNNNNNSNDSPLNRSNNYLNILLNNPGNAYNNKNLPSLDQKLLATILAIRQNGTSALGQNLHTLQPFGSQLPFNCCDLSLSDLNNNSSCTNGFGCSCTGCSGGQLDYPRNSVVLSSMMMNGPQNHQGDAKSVKSKDDRSSEMNFQSSSSILSGLNLVSPNHVFNDPGGGGKQNASPYLALQCDMGLSYIMAGDRAQDEALRFAGIDSSIMAFSDISSNSNSSSSSSPTDVTERTAY